MMDCLRALGFVVDEEAERERIAVHGLGAMIPAKHAALFVGNSGTTARFVTPLAALGHGTYVLDGVARMRERPIGDLLNALQALGVRAESVAGNGCPPLRIHADGLHGGSCTIRADKSSQFLSGLLLAAPCAKGTETVITVDGPLLSAPYITITVEMIRAFGGVIHVSDDGRTFHIPGSQTYQTPENYAVEPDASSATYFWAMAAITGGTVRVPGIGRNALQGDAKFVDVLAAMGCSVQKGDDFIEVTGTDKLTGGRFDMNAISDTVMTLAAVAPFADSPTVIENIAHIRHKETDRITATVTELRRLGIRVDEHEDSFIVYPCANIVPTEPVQTYDDHRMAMAFSLIGLRVPSVQIADPACVNKTFPDYFARLDRLVRS
jgi:3-phosphoshikimate 1-carboxyvinyltransferase